MAPTPMKAKKAVVQKMSKGALADVLAKSTELKKSQVSKVLDALASTATAQVKKAGIFTIPGICRIKSRTKPATKAGKRTVFGKEMMVKDRELTTRYPQPSNLNHKSHLLTQISTPRRRSLQRPS